MNEERWSRGLVFGAIAAGLGARLAFAMTDDGIFWPDEIYQSLEPAHRLVFGYGFQAWEFLEGARHWTLPGLVALLFRIAGALGLSYPEQTMAFTRGAFCVASAAVPFGVWRLARVQGAQPFDAAIGAFAAALMGLTVYFAPRATGETLSALPLVFGLALALELKARRGARLAGVALLALAVFLRLQNAIFCLSVLGVWLWRKERRATLEALGLFVFAGVVYGLVDLFTWGDFLHSFKVYVRYNLLEGKASGYGTEGPWFYPWAMLLSEGRVLLPLAVLGIIGRKKAAALWAVWLPFFLVHSLLPHKELRFVYVLVPLLAAIGAVGLTALREQKQSWIVSTRLLVLVVAALSAFTMRTLTFGRLAVRNPGPRSLSAIDYSGPENRLLMKAGHLADVCGLRITSTEHWRTGGYAYFHKQVPLYGLQPRSGSDQSYNYLIGRGAPPEGTVVARDGEAWLLSLNRAECAPDPGYDWHLE